MHIVLLHALPSSMYVKYINILWLSSVVLSLFLQCFVPFINPLYRKKKKWHMDHQSCKILCCYIVIHYNIKATMCNVYVQDKKTWSGSCLLQMFLAGSSCRRAFQYILFSHTNKPHWQIYICGKRFLHAFEKKYVLCAYYATIVYCCETSVKPSFCLVA